MKRKIFIFTFFPLFLLYFMTASSTVYWQDSGLYLTGVKTLGIIYPPGNPLYLLFAFIWTRLFSFLPLGVNFTKLTISFSGFWGALSSFMVGITVFEILDWFTKTEHEGNKKAVTPKAQTIILISIISGLLSGTSYSLWSQSINAEVYSMISFFIAFIFYLLIRIYIILIGQKPSNGSEIRKLVLLIIIFFGLSFSVHPLVMLVAPVLVIFGFIYKDKLHEFMGTKYILIYLIVAVMSVIVPLLYLPIRAYFQPDFVWSKIDNVRDLINYLLSKEYFSGERSLVLTNFQRLATFPKLLFSELNIHGIAIFSLGIFELLKRNSRKAVLRFVIFTSLIFYTVLLIYNQGTEYNYWLIPIYDLFYVLIGIGFWTVFVRIINYWDLILKRSKSKFINIIEADGFIWILGIVMVFISIGINFKYNNRRNYVLPREFGVNILKNLPQNSMLFTIGDQDSSITTYLQLVEDYRKDILLVWPNSFPDEWKLSRLKKNHPDLYIPEFSVDLLSDSEEYGLFLKSFFDNNIKNHEIFLIQKSIVDLPDDYKIVPAGAIWKVVKNDEPIFLGFWDYQFSDNDRYQFPQKKESSKRVRNDMGLAIGEERVFYSDESKNFELQAYKNLADICFENFKNGKTLLVKNNNGMLETYLTGQLLFCARDNYEKMVTLDPGFFREDIWIKRQEIYLALGDNEKARQLEVDIALKGNKLNN